MSPESRAVHVGAEVQRADEALRAAGALLGLGLLNDAVSRAYYAALHYAVALLLTEGVEPRTHGRVGAMIGLHFVMPGHLHPGFGKDLARLEQFRGEADYNRFFVLDAAGAAEELDVATRFCEAARGLLRTRGFLG